MKCAKISTLGYDDGDISLTANVSFGRLNVVTYFTLCFETLNVQVHVCAILKLQV